jgi:hypothetical protein
MTRFLLGAVELDASGKAEKVFVTHDRNHEAI